MAQPLNWFEKVVHPSLVSGVQEHVDLGGSVEREVFGTDDALVVSELIDDFCGDRFGVTIEACLFYCSSAGSVTGLQLADGRRVVVKAYQARWGESFLSAVGAVQGHLFRSGFPCAQPLVGPSALGPALATAEEFIPDPGIRPLRSSEEMSASALGLAQLVSLSRPINEPGLSNHPLNTPAAEQLYPKPHSPAFDFSLDVSGAAWIDELALAAKEARGSDARPGVIGHADWSARNIRVEGPRFLVAYDWDSLTVAAESVIVGQAAATWRSFGEPTRRLAPDVREVHRYIAAYQQASGYAFEGSQLRSALAAALWVLAYTARCEHALEAATGLRLVHARARLRDGGRSFLEWPRG